LVERLLIALLAPTKRTKPTESALAAQSGVRHDR
jgi:hypothetical protein